MRGRSADDRHRSRREFAVDMGAPAKLGVELGATLTELP
jgi:hypothetical protein